jgi:hypothetical protein
LAPSSRLQNAVAHTKSVTCEDCYFRQQSLCALALEHPCPTFRAAGRMLQPPLQPRLVPRALGAAAA